MTPALNLKESILDQVAKKDVLLSYPFESMKPFLRMLHEAAEDDSVVSIKMTLYRVAERSKVIDALIEAAENGKEVVVLVELRARFDEANNIEMSKRLEDAGCHIIYGLGMYKVHSKLCLITRHTEQGLSYITQIGTGNYNEKTSRLYTDLSLLTGNQKIGAEAARVFKSLMLGETVEQTEHLLVAPKCLQNKVIAMIDAEEQKALRGEPAYVGVKINSLTDKAIIEKLIEASKAGVNPNTMQRAITQLETLGLVTTNRTLGRTVTENAEALEEMRRRLAVECAESYFKEMGALGYSRGEAADMAQAERDRNDE